MPFTPTNLRVLACNLFLFSVVFVGAVSYAEEEGAKPEGAAAEDKGAHEFAEKQGKANALASKLEESDKKFKELIEEKEVATTPDAKQEIIRDMIKLKEDRAKDQQAFEALKSELNLRYPDEGGSPKRRYQTETPRTEEESEAETAQSLDDMLTRTKRMIDKKYAPFMADEPKAPTKRQPASNEAAPRLRLEK